MNLKLARASYHLQQINANSLWKSISWCFSERMLAQVGDPEYSDELYVRRTSGDGLTRDEMLEYLCSAARRLFLVLGDPGVGKTTFLHHELRPELEREGYAHVWVDVMRDVDASGFETPEAERVKAAILRRISSELQRFIDGSASTLAWWKFLLQQREDTTGLARLVLGELDRARDEADLSPDARSHLFQVLKEAEPELLETIRAKVRFVRQTMKRIPVLVLDNIDQLRIRTARMLAATAYVLAEGSQPSVSHGSPPRGPCDSIKVFLALRPFTYSTAQQAFGVVHMSRVLPFDISEAMRRRLRTFLAGFNGKVLKGPAQQEWRLRAGDAAAYDEEEARQDILKMLWWTTSETEGSPHAEPLALMRRLTNSNMRHCLIAVTGFLASGHLDWVEVALAMRAGEPARSVLTPRKIKHALFLGTQAVYDGEKSWLINLFNDGVADEQSVLVRPRLLFMLWKRPNATSTEIFDDASALFQYSGHRLKVNWTFFLERRLVEERASERFCLTDAGACYLRTMPSDFEYLQHVAMDSYVDNEHLVRCTSKDESKATRLDRVVKFVSWVRDLEVASLRSIRERGLQDLYTSYFGDDVMSAVLAGCLEQALNWIFGEGEEAAAARMRGMVADLRASTCSSAMAERARA